MGVNLAKAPRASRGLDKGWVCQWGYHKAVCRNAMATAGCQILKPFPFAIATAEYKLYIMKQKLKPFSVFSFSKHPHTGNTESHNMCV